MIIAPLAVRISASGVRTWPCIGTTDAGGALAEYNIDLIPFDDDLLSMEIDSSFKVRPRTMRGRDVVVPNLPSSNRSATWRASHRHCST